MLSGCNTETEAEDPVLVQVIYKDHLSMQISFNTSGLYPPRSLSLCAVQTLSSRSQVLPPKHPEEKTQIKPHHLRDTFAQCFSPNWSVF